MEVQPPWGTGWDIYGNMEVEPPRGSGSPYPHKKPPIEAV